MTTHNTREVEGVVEKELRLLLAEYGQTGDDSRIANVLEAHDQQLQKARGEAVIWTMRNFETMHKEDWGTKTFGEYMIDRYHSELDQPTNITIDK